MARREKPLRLDMSFNEALERFAQTEPSEIEAKKQNKSRKRPKLVSNDHDNVARDRIKQE
jgi:hypothetical protein